MLHFSLAVLIFFWEFACGQQKLYDKYWADILESLSGPYASRGNFTELIFSETSSRGGLWISDGSDSRWSDGVSSHFSSSFPSLDILSRVESTLKSLPKLRRTYSIFNPPPERRDTLIVLTTCNHKKTTLIALHFIKKSLDVADLIIVDDHSIDGTVPYLVKKGYFVVSKPVGNGLTASWNIGYHIAVRMGYKYVMFSNNDVLVPRGAIAELKSDLRDEVLVVPLTTPKGAGHHPGQNILNAFKLPDMFHDHVNDPRNAQDIQTALMKRIKREKGAKRIVPSTWQGETYFNGFFFALNVSGIARVAAHFPDQLFDTKLVMVGQEGWLTWRLRRMQILPKLTLAAFMYHFKSVTVKAANYKWWQGKAKDRRDKLALYHPELGSLKEEKNYPLLYWDSDVYRPRLYGLDVTPIVPRTGRKEDWPVIGNKEWASSRGVVIGMVTSDPQSNPDASDVMVARELASSLLKRFQEAIDEIRFLPRGSSWFDVDALAEVDVLIVMLDSFNLCRALGVAGEGRSRARGMGAQWKELKPSLFTIAWMRVNFNKWLKRPWIGNYDLLLTSSGLAANFFKDFNNKFGLQTCAGVGSPSIMLPELLPSTGAWNLSNGRRKVTGRRVRVHVDVLREATSSRRGDIVDKSLPFPSFARTKFAPDFAYFGSPKKQEAPFDLSAIALSHRKGLLLGAGWKQGNGSNGWRDVFTGTLRHTQEMQVFQAVKVVIDDVDRDAALWGGVTRRVLDALASGVLVISSAANGMKDFFPTPLSPLIFTTRENLRQTLEFYINDTSAREAQTKPLRYHIMRNHTYDVRAKELGKILRLFGVYLTKNTTVAKTPRRPQSASESNEITVAVDARRTMCVGVRTAENQRSHIEALLRSMLQVHKKGKDSLSRGKRGLGIHVFIMEAEISSPQFHDKLLNIVSRLNGELRDDVVHLVTDESAPKREGKNPFYGYDITDRLLGLLLGLPQCEWIMFTDGNNMYHKEWFDVIEPHLNDGRYDIVGWDFVAPNARKSNGQQIVNVSLERGSMNLGSIIIRSGLYQRSGARFLPESLFTVDLFARDYFAINMMKPFTRPDSVKLIHRCLLFHP